MRDSNRTSPLRPLPDHWLGTAYGLLLEGLQQPGLLDPVQYRQDLPTVRVRQSKAVVFRAERVSTRSAVIPMLGGEAAIINRDSGLVCHHSAAPTTDGSLIHPFLTIVGTVYAWWLNRDAFHAGAFLGRNGALALLGPRNAGKSTLLASLSAMGTPIVADDLVVLEHGIAFPGPRCIDLRADAPDRLGLREGLTPVRDEGRIRWTQPTLGVRPPVVGWIALEWGDRTSLAPLGPAARLALLQANCCVPHRSGRGLLELAALPAWSLRRPRDWAALDGAVERLLALAGR